MEKNEFDDIEGDDVPSQDFSKATTTDSIIANSSGGIVYDYNAGPDIVKAPARINLNGKIVTIKKANIILPPMDSTWELTKDKSKEYKSVRFTLFYDIEGQQESLSGLRVFKRIDNNKVLYSHPTMPKDRKSQASNLMGLYADYKKKDINEITMKEFLSFLNSKPKAIIKTAKVINPSTNAVIDKNLIEKFV
jgi:hypothetical protein